MDGGIDMDCRQKTPVDSLKWANYIVKGGYFGVFLVTFAHIVWYFAAREYLAVSPEDYVKYYIVLSTVGLLAVNVSVDMAIRSHRVPIRVKEYISSFLLVVYAIYLVMTHEIAVVLLGTFMLAIFMSAVFSKVEITNWVFFVCLVSLLLFSIKTYLAGNMANYMIMQIFSVVLLMICSYLMARILIQHYHDNLKAIVRSNEEATKSELAFLQTQIKPHFLYNAINTIVSFCYTDSTRAADLLINFSKYLRLVFDIDNRTLTVPLQTELDLVKVYVEIEKARFGEIIDVEYDIAPELLAIEIPAFCIQPLVENAIKHGLCKKAGGGIVSISVQRNTGAFTIGVRDTGAGISKEELERLRDIKAVSGGVGLKNVARRIQTWRNATMDIQSTVGEGTLVTLYIADDVS
jgi:two-component system LytT family sensor kinase